MKFDIDGEQAYQRRGCLFIFITALARVVGLITLVVLAFGTHLEWFSGGSKNFQIYITYVLTNRNQRSPMSFCRVVTIIVGYLELLWILDKCVTCCICCFR